MLPEIVEGMQVWCEEPNALVIATSTPEAHDYVEHHVWGRRENKLYWLDRADQNGEDQIVWSGFELKIPVPDWGEGLLGSAPVVGSPVAAGQPEAVVL